MTDEKEVGKRIKRIRKELRLRQQDFARRLNISGPSLSEIETGKYKPGFDLMVNLVKEFNVNLYYLLFGEGEMFQTVVQKHLGGIPAIGANSKDVEKFLWYFERSSIMQYYIMSVFKNKLLQDKTTIEQEIEELEREESEHP